MVHAIKYTNASALSSQYPDPPTQDILNYLKSVLGRKTDNDNLTVYYAD